MADGDSSLKASMVLSASGKGPSSWELRKMQPQGMFGEGWGTGRRDKKPYVLPFQGSPLISSCRIPNTPYLYGTIVTKILFIFDLIHLVG